MKKNKVVLRFCVWGYNDITHEELTEMTGVVPYKTYTKGTKHDHANNIIKENGWIFESGMDDSSFEIQMNAIINVIEEKITIFSAICEKYYCEFSCAVYLRNQNESTPAIHLDARYNNLIKKLNIEFDLDLY